MLFLQQDIIPFHLYIGENLHSPQSFKQSRKIRTFSDIRHHVRPFTNRKSYHYRHFWKKKENLKFLLFKMFYLNKSQADKILPSFCKRVIKTSPPFKAALILAARLSGGLV